MAYMQWTPSLGVGVAELDEDHKLLIRLIGSLEDAVGYAREEQAIRTVLDTLIEYTVHHFAREEKVMAASGYPDLERHRAEHRELTARVKEVQRRVHGGGASALGPEVMEFLKEWLTNHILKEDMAYRPYAEGNPEAAEAAGTVPKLRLPENLTPSA